MNPASLAMLALGLVAVGVVLHLTSWRAWLFLRPGSIRVEPDAPPDQVNLPEELFALSKELLKLGFRPLGSHYEKPRFTRETVSYDYLLEGKPVFATLYLGRDGGARLYLLTPLRCPDGQQGAIVTANYRRPAREIKGCYYSGGLEDYAPDRILKAHLRRIDNERLQPQGELTLDGRVAAARAWFEGFGRVEIRWQNLHGLLWSAGAVAMGILGLLRFLG